MRGSELKPLTVPAMDVSKTRLADVDCPFQHGCEHRLKIAWRATDDLQDFRSGGLLVQRLGQLTRALLLRLEQSHVLDAMRAWSAKVVIRSICFSVKGSTLVFQSVIVPIGVPSRS